MRMLLQVTGLVILLASWAQLSAGENSVAGSSIPPMKGTPQGGDFTLLSKSGQVSTKAFRGKVLMLYFGYTQCPDVCPTSLSFMTQSLNELDTPELEKVAGLFVSVDPKRDSVTSLADYVGYFHPNFVGVTGSAEAIANAAELYGAQYSFTETNDSAMGYIVNHSATIYLIDQTGVLRFAFPHETPPETMLGAMRMLFEEGST